MLYGISIFDVLRRRNVKEPERYSLQQHELLIKFVQTTVLRAGHSTDCWNLDMADVLDN